MVGGKEIDGYRCTTPEWQGITDQELVGDRVATMVMETLMEVGGFDVVPTPPVSPKTSAPMISSPTSHFSFL